MEWSRKGDFESIRREYSVLLKHLLYSCLIRPRCSSECGNPQPPSPEDHTYCYDSAL